MLLKILEEIYSSVEIYKDLLDSNADSDRVDGPLDEHLLLVVTADHHRLKQQLLTAPVNTHLVSFTTSPSLFAKRASAGKL